MITVFIEVPGNQQLSYERSLISAAKRQLKKDERFKNVWLKRAMCQGVQIEMTKEIKPYGKNGRTITHMFFVKFDIYLGMEAYLT